MHIISYVESEIGRHFLPPTDWPDGAFTWLCRHRVFPDLAATPWAEYSDNDQYLHQLHCIGQGEYDPRAGPHRGHADRLL